MADITPQPWTTLGTDVKTPAVSTTTSTTDKAPVNTSITNANAQKPVVGSLQYKATNNPTATYGENSASTLALQKQLNATNAGKAGYVPIPEDSKYGPLTQKAANFKATDTTGQNNTNTNGTNTGSDAGTIKTPQDQVNDLNSKYDAAYKTFSDTMSQYTNGTIPLTAGEQAQIDGLKLQTQQLIDQSKQTNLNGQNTARIAAYRGGAAEGTDLITNTINPIIQKGVQNVNDLNIKLASAVADLTDKFKTNDMKGIKDAWDEYQQYTKDRTTTLQKTIDDTTAAVKDARDFAYKQQQDKIKNDMEYKKYALDVQKAEGDNIGSSLSAAGLDVLAKGYLTSGVLPSFGLGKQGATMKANIINRAVELAGGADNVNPSLNKAMYDANRATLKQQQQNYTVANTAYNIFDKNGQLALTLTKGLNNSNSPAINQLTNKVINQTTGQGQLDSFRAVLTSLQSEYATLINVKGGGGGQVTEGDKAKSEKAIPMDISPARLNDVLTNLKKEGSNVLTERKQTIDDLQNNIVTAGNAFNNKVQDNPLIGQVATAKTAGYSSQDIVQNLLKNDQYKDSAQKAKDAGYTDDEIINFLTQ